MNKTKIKILTGCLIMCLTTAVKADINTVEMIESEIPRNICIESYELSPRNHDNSILNHNNSESNSDNRSAILDNAPMNFKNYMGERKIYGLDKFPCGYYVTNSNGVTNFFSRRGKRLFYNPKKGDGLYQGQTGEFCGIIFMKGSEKYIAVTELGKGELTKE